HRYGAQLKNYAVPVGAGLPAIGPLDSTNYQNLALAAAPDENRLKMLNTSCTPGKPEMYQALSAINCSSFSWSSANR
ncbi:hypothetical protein, partial [Pseudomonas sp.]|uniref:hypothetical protein n=1 Tax=Pseudomonas sp. TaxID=306 RepID=UPI003C78535D